MKTLGARKSLDVGDGGQHVMGMGKLRLFNISSDARLLVLVVPFHQHRQAGVVRVTWSRGAQVEEEVLKYLGTVSPKEPPQGLPQERPLKLANPGPELRHQRWHLQVRHVTIRSRDAFVGLD